MALLSVHCDGNCENCPLSIIETEDGVEVVNCKAEKLAIPIKNELKEAFEEDDEE